MFLIDTDWRAGRLPKVRKLWRFDPWIDNLTWSVVHFDCLEPMPEEVTRAVLLLSHNNTEVFIDYIPHERR